MKDTTWETTLQRLMEATNSPNDAALATRLGISAQAVYNARKKQQIPPAWVFEAAKTFSVSADWLFFGKERGQRGDEDTTPHLASGPSERANTIGRELEAEREERRALSAELREVSAENRQLHRDKAELLKEVGDLRAKVARLEAGQNRLAVTNGMSSENSGAA